MKLSNKSIKKISKHFNKNGQWAKEVRKQLTQEEKQLGNKDMKNVKSVGPTALLGRMGKELTAVFEGSEAITCIHISKHTFDSKTPLPETHPKDIVKEGLPWWSNG